MEQISSLLAAAAVGGFAITAVAGKFMIPALHRLHFGQTIREEGPTWHSKKNGTPTMGGLCFILGILATLGIVWVMYSPKLPEVLGMPQLQAGMLVLFLLQQKPMYTYDIMRRVEEITEGALTFNTLYIAIYRLKEFGYVEEFERRLSEDNHARVYFTITESGRKYLKDIIAEYRQMTAAIDAVLSSGGDEA